jgi:hypothetical protein
MAAVKEDDRRARSAVLVVVLDMSGTSLEPPATRSSGPALVGRPREVAADRPARTWTTSPRRSSSTRCGDMAVVEALDGELESS